MGSHFSYLASKYFISWGIRQRSKAKDTWTQYNDSVVSQQSTILQKHSGSIFDKNENEPIFKFSLFDYLVWMWEVLVPVAKFNESFRMEHSLCPSNIDSICFR